MDVWIEEARQSDLDGIMELEIAGFEQGIVEERQVFERRLGAFPEGFLVARNSDGSQWAYLCFEIWKAWTVAEHSRFELGHDIARYHDPRGTWLYLASMTIAPVFRGQGLGFEVLNSALSQMKARFPRLQDTVLIVDRRWQSARRVYEKAGFRENGTIPNFFHPSDTAASDALVMIRPL